MKKLFRSHEGYLGGVCGGIAKYMDIDPSIVRLIWAIVTLCSMGVGLFIYLLCWLIIPLEP